MQLFFHQRHTLLFLLLYFFLILSFFNINFFWTFGILSLPTLFHSIEGKSILEQHNEDSREEDKEKKKQSHFLLYSRVKLITKHSTLMSVSDACQKHQVPNQQPRMHFLHPMIPS